MNYKSSICNYVSQCRTMKQIYDLPYKLNIFKKTSLKGFKIAIVSIPCGGFGDIVFATKLFEYAKKWYRNSNVKIVTTTPEMFKTIGINSKDIIIIKNTKSKYQDCVFSQREI